MKQLLIILSILLFSFLLKAQTIYVSGDIDESTTWDVDTVKVTGNVSIQNNALLSIEPGTYVELQGHYHIYIKGALEAVGTETDSIYFTVNDTTGFHIMDSIHGGWHGLRFSWSYPDTSILSYCKMEYAKGTDGIEGYTTSDMGSAIYCTHSNLKISNCLIQNNNSMASGAICFENNNNSFNLVEDNLIRYNKTFKYGAGVYSYVSSPQIINNTIIQNHAYESGGGILCSGSTVLISGNIICNNKADYSGGISISWGSTATITNNLICNNSYGIGVSTSDALIVNNSICNNLSRGAGFADANVDVYNTILWGNMADQEEQIYIGYGGTTNFYNCNIEGDTSSIYLAPGATISNYDYNIDADPNFANPSSGSGSNYIGYNSDWSLLQNSPCINSGSPDTTGLMLPEFDIYGNERIVNSIVDIGASEYQFEQLIKSNKENISIHIYPNPANDFVCINFDNLNGFDALIEITDINGNVVYHKFINGSYMFVNENIDISALKSGLYFIQILNKNGKFLLVEKLIIN